MAAALLFALSRRLAGDARPVLVTAPRAWFGEYGRPYGPGLPGVGLIVAPAATAAEALWALEEALRSGAVSRRVGTVKAATLAQTRRLDFAAGQGGPTAVLLRADAGRAQRGAAALAGLDRGSAPPIPTTPAAPGATRLTAELARGRGERPGRLDAGAGR